MGNKFLRLFLIIFFSTAIFVFVSCSEKDDSTGPGPTASVFTATVTMTSTEVVLSPTITKTNTPLQPTLTVTATVTLVPPTATSTKTSTPLATATTTKTATQTSTKTNTPVPTATITLTVTATVTAIPTANTALADALDMPGWHVVTKYTPWIEVPDGAATGGSYARSGAVSIGGTSVMEVIITLTGGNQLISFEWMLTGSHIELAWYKEGDPAWNTEPNMDIMDATWHANAVGIGSGAGVYHLIFTFRGSSTPVGFGFLDNVSVMNY